MIYLRLIKDISIICIDDGSDAIKYLLQVIDGQQRLTTLSLLISALYSAIQNLISQDQALELRLFKETRLNRSWLKIQSMLWLDDIDNNRSLEKVENCIY